MLFLTAGQKQQRVNVCEELQIASDDAALLSRVITGEEGWIAGYDPETKQQSCQCKIRAKSREVSSYYLTLRGLFTKNSS
jgi:hypothetical protein